MSVYTALADHIDHVFREGLGPQDEDRPFVRIFGKMLTEEEASLMCSLSETGMFCKEIAGKGRLETEKAQNLLTHLSQIGMIYEKEENGQMKYQLMPFIPGIFESILKDVKDPEIAHLQDLFIKELHERRGERVIPVNQVIRTEIKEASLSEIEAYLDATDQYGLMDCICRKSRAVSGHACGHPIHDICIVLGEYADYYIRIGNAHPATRDEIVEVLKKAESLGLHHEFYPIEGSKSVFLCNCCTCGCMFMSLADRIREVTASDNTVSVDPSRCNLCGACVQACPGSVFHFSKDRSRVLTDPEGCFHCRLCLHVCPSRAILLQ